jgi:hypothetical protein
VIFELLVNFQNLDEDLSKSRSNFHHPHQGSMKVNLYTRNLELSAGKSIDPVESWSLAKSKQPTRNTTTVIFPQTKLERWLLKWCDTTYYDGRPKTLLRGLSHELAFFSIPYWSWLGLPKMQHHWLCPAEAIPS